jgi:predicted N-acetyltransferase YhbS
MNIIYKINAIISTDDFIDILNRSTLWERRPIGKLECISDMLTNADILVVALEGEKIVGVARSITDFSYCCYLSDLAVDVTYQHQGIGKMLIAKTKECLKDGCKIILVSAPKATEYYPKIGFKQHPSAWVLEC